VLVGLVEFTRTSLYTVYLPQSHAALFGLGTVGLAATVQYLADTLLRSPGGHLVERYGVSRILPLSAVLAAVSAIGAIYAPSSGWLFLASFANGLSIAPLWPTLLTFSSRASHDDEKGRAIGVTFTFVAPFIGLGVLLTGFLYDRSPQLAAAALSFTQLLIALWGLLVLPRLTSRDTPVLANVRASFPWEKIAYLAPGALAQMFTLGLLTPVIFPYLKGLGYSTSDLLVVLIVGGGIEVLLISPLGRLVDKHRPVDALVIALLLAPFALIGFTMIEKFYVFLLVAAYTGAVQALLVTSWGAVISHTLPEEHKTTAWGAVMTLEGLGFALGPVFGGYSWQLFGSRSPFYIGSALFLLAAVYYLYHRPRA